MMNLTNFGVLSSRATMRLTFVVLSKISHGTWQTLLAKHHHVNIVRMLALAFSSKH